MANRKTSERLVATIAGNKLEFNLVDADGLAVAGYNPVQVDLDGIPETLHQRLAMHGLKQKVADAAAIPRDDKGRPASWSAKLSAMQAVVGALYAGDWSQRGEGGASPAGLLFTAFCRLYPDVSPDAIREKLAAMSKADQAKYRKVPKVAAMIETIKAERADAGDESEEVDPDALFDDLA